MSETLFAKIVAGQLPCHRIYACPDTLAFLDIAPLSPGHTLLVPRRPVAHLAQLSEGEGAALGRALVLLCRALVQWSGEANINVLQNNGQRAHQTVMHVHFHLIPKPQAAGGLQLQWQSGQLAPGEGQAQATALRALVGGAAAAPAASGGVGS